jgi:hypothetical protein
MLCLFYFALQLAQGAEIGRVSVLVKTVGDDSSGGFIDDTEDLEAGNSSSIFCCLVLSVVEVWSGVSREILPICRIETSQTGDGYTRLWSGPTRSACELHELHSLQS